MIVLSLLIGGCTLNNPTDLGTGPSVLRPVQGGTGLGTAVAGDVGKTIKVTDDSPLTYEFATDLNTGSGTNDWKVTSTDETGYPLSFESLTTTSTRDVFLQKSLLVGSSDNNGAEGAYGVATITTKIATPLITDTSGADTFTFNSMDGNKFAFSGVNAFTIGSGFASTTGKFNIGVSLGTLSGSALYGAGDLFVGDDATTTGSFAAPEICLANDCRTAWPSVVAGGSALGDLSDVATTTSGYGKLLVEQTNGTFDLIATSTLKVAYGDVVGTPSSFATLYNATTTLNGFSPSLYFLAANFQSSWDTAFNGTSTWAYFTTNWNTLFNATSTFGGRSATATALAANGTNCNAGSYARGVDASGNAENCTADTGSGTNDWQVTSTGTTGTALFKTSVTPTSTISVYVPQDLVIQGNTTSTGNLIVSGADGITLASDGGFNGRDTNGAEVTLLTANGSNDAHFLANVGNGNILDSAYGFFNSDVPVIMGDSCCGGGQPTSLTFNTTGDINFDGSLFIEADNLNVGIGDTTPTEAKLVVGSAGGGDIYASFASSANSEALCWDASGASLITDCTSLAKWKTNIVDLPLGLNTILQLQPRQFNWIKDGRPDLGFIAEEVALVNPLLASYSRKDTRATMTDDELIAYYNDGKVPNYDALATQLGLQKKKTLDGKKQETNAELADRAKKALVESLRSDGSKEILTDWELAGVKYEHLTALLVKGIQEQQAELDSLEARVTALETPIGGQSDGLWTRIKNFFMWLIR